MTKKFLVPFATTGDKTAVPTTVQVDGTVSYPEGYGDKYSLPTSDPDTKKIERVYMNQLFNDVTAAIGELQTQGIPNFITSAENGGTPYSYKINAYVRYTDDKVYRSKTNTNTALPTDPTYWTDVTGTALGAVTVDSLNKIVFTPPATGATITIADGKTLSITDNATVSGTNTGDQTDATLTFTDITTNDSTTLRHGFLKKLQGSASFYMDGSGNWSVPIGATPPTYNNVVGIPFKTFTGTADGTTNIGDALQQFAIDNVNADGRSFIAIAPGNYRLEKAFDVSALVAAGVTELVIKGAGKKASRFNHRINVRCMDWDQTSRWGAAIPVQSITKRVFDIYNYVDALKITDVATYFSKFDRFNLQSLDHPEYDSSFSRWVGEGQSVKSVGYSVAITNIVKGTTTTVTSASHNLLTGDRISISDVLGMTQINGSPYTITVVDANTFTLDGVNSSGYSDYTSGGQFTTLDLLFVDGWLEWQLDGLYQNNMVVHRIPNDFKLTITDCGFYPNVPTQGVTTARNTGSCSIYMAGMSNVEIYNCHFDDPWWISNWIKSSVDIYIHHNTYKRGLNFPAQGYAQITYFSTFYGACWNCRVAFNDGENYRHVATSDGNASANTNTNGSNAGFTTVNASAVVTVNKNSHGLVAGDYVQFTGSTTANGVTISGRYIVLGGADAPTTNAFKITASAPASSAGNFGSNVAFTFYKQSQITEYGQPTNCTVEYNYNIASHGAPWDTHVEGANIRFIGNVSVDPHSSDSVTPSAFIGSHYQVRARRVTIKGGMHFGGNGGINVKVSEQGTECWVKIEDTLIVQDTYQSDNGRGLYVTNESGSPVNLTKIQLKNVAFDQHGVSVESDVPVKIQFQSLQSLRPHRGHVDLAPGCTFNGMNLYWDSDCAVLPGSQIQGRTLHGIQVSGDFTSTIANFQHSLGSDATKNTPQIYSVVDATKTITAITKAANASITSTAHGYLVNDVISIAGAAGMVEINGGPYTVQSVPDANTFTINVNSTGFTTYSGSAGRAMKITGTKFINLTGYSEIDPYNIGPRPILQASRESNFSVDVIQCVNPRVQVHTAGAVAKMLAESDYLIVNKTVGGATTVNYTPTKKLLTFKDGKGDAATNNITLTPSTGLLDGSATQLIAAPYRAVASIFDGTNSYRV